MGFTLLLIIVNTPPTSELILKTLRPSLVAEVFGRQKDEKHITHHLTHH